jgi:RimJ/RimL family protein N-acetyltransferase
MSPSIPTPCDPALVSSRIRSSHPAPFTGAPNAYELAISEGGTNTGPIGIAGLYGIDYGHSVAEIGVSILQSDAQGRGLGVEAHKRWIEYAFSDLGLFRLTGTAKAGNERAVTVAQRVGMTIEGRLRSHRFVAGHRMDILLFGLLKEEWIAAKELFESVD